MTEEATNLNAGSMPIIAWSGLTDVGRYRKNNEDAFLALTVDGNGATSWEIREGEPGKS